jgi:serine/threonine protein kinase
MQSSSRHPPADGSTGEKPRSLADAAFSPSEDQPTVISNRPPLKASSANKSASEATTIQLAPGTRLGHFELLEFVGGGGMGRVYRAMDSTLNRFVALKVLSPEQASDSETLLRFRNEARSAARLNHDGIVQVYYVGEDAGLPFIAFEFVEGVNVRVLVEQKGRLALAEAVSYTLQVAEALAHADSRDVVHRDIKPSNILITADSRAKLIDMGLARLQAADNPDGDLTASGVTLGTFDYISPEQARDPRNADVRSDIYSLGCTFFYMLTGRPPFPEGTVLQKLLQHQGDEPPDVRQLRPDLPEEVSRVLRKMMAKEPRRRYQDPAKLIMGLLVLAELAGLQRVGPGQTVWVAPREPEVTFLERHLPWLAPIAALGGIVLLLHLVWSSSGSTSVQPTIPLASAPASLAPEVPIEGLLPDDEITSGSEMGQQDHAGPPPGSRFQSSQRSERTASSAPATAPADLHPLAGESEKPESPTPNSRSLPPPTTARLAATDPSTATSFTTMSDEGLVAIVNADRQSVVRYASLAAACSAAVDGDVIELCFNGRREEKPASLVGRQVTIRAGDGFQPVLVFRPTEADPIRYSRSMITSTGSRLNISDVAIELEVPREIPADSWSLFQISEGQELNLESCSLTIRNASDQQTAYHPEVAFVQVKSALPADVVMGGEVLATRRATVGLIDCIARGEAVFLRLDDLQPVSLTWHNGLLVTTEHLLLADGGDRDPLADETIQLDLQHLTAVVRAGMCRMNQTAFAPHPWPLHIHATGNIFVAAAASPLLEQIGVADVAEAMARLTWDGEHNFYEGFTVFWRIRQLGLDAAAQVMTFDDWQAYWRPERESLPSWNLVQWRQLPAISRPTHMHTPADYTLRSTNNPPLRAAGDDRDAGLQGDRLPLLPAETTGF